LHDDEFVDLKFASPCIIIQGVPLANETCFSLIILPPMRILQRNLKRTYLIV